MHDGVSVYPCGLAHVYDCKVSVHPSVLVHVYLCECVCGACVHGVRVRMRVWIFLRVE